MSRWWEIIAPAGIAGFGALAYWAARLSRPVGDHRADPARLQEAPDVRTATVPVAKVAGLPPWAAPEADRYNGYGWISGSSGSDFDGAWLLSPDLQVNWIDDSPREDGAGDESEGHRLSAPPAPNPQWLDEQLTDLYAWVKKVMAS